ncbi:MAG: TPM domain-containing protein [Oscillospiraceae bacterium]|nr:TPM domain-containing protein [Oscillospiraceae bacterium]
MKRILALLLTLLLLGALLAVPVLADEPARLVDDSAGLLTREERDALEAKALELRELGVDAVIQIMPEEPGDPDEYANRFINADGWGALTKGSGVLMLLVTPDGEHGSYYLYSFGDASRISLEDLSADAASEFRRYSFPEALDAYLDDLRAFVVALNEGSSYSYTPDEPEPQELPPWYPEDVDSFQEFNDPDAPRMVDSAQIFSPTEEARILAKVNEIRSKYNVDLVVFTDSSTYGFPRYLYAEDYFVFNGYGFGPRLDGSILFISMEPGNRGWYSAFSGTAENMIDSEKLNYIDDQMEPYMIDGEYADGVLAYLDALDYVYGHGRIPLNYTGPALAGIVLGLIVAAITSAVLKSQMNKVHKATAADTYVRPGSFNLTGSRDVYLYSTYTRTRRSSERTGGGGGGGSSGFSHSSSSSGHSFSGGGRSF